MRRGVSPHARRLAKLFEFLAAGKPVVATPMREICKYPSVRLAGTPDEFVAQIEEAVALGGDPAQRARLRAEAHANTWRARAQQLQQAMARASAPVGA